MPSNGSSLYSDDFVGSTSGVRKHEAAERAKLDVRARRIKAKTLWYVKVSTGANGESRRQLLIYLKMTRTSSKGREQNPVD